MGPAPPPSEVAHITRPSRPPLSRGCPPSSRGSAEVDRVFKKIAEGIENFEDIWKKLYSTDNANQREKFEADLKKEIKKLQRLRDQVKTWVASGDIKDKKPLLEQRRLIETVRLLPVNPGAPCRVRVSHPAPCLHRVWSSAQHQQMERFKSCEKEMKTKAYSKEGLASNKMDPHEKAKSDTRRWLGDVLDRIGSQIDAYEAEVEVLQAKKRVAVQQERLELLERMLDRHRHHQSRLEVIQRLLDNDSLEPDSINVLRDDIVYYVDSHEVRAPARVASARIGVWALGTGHWGSCSRARVTAAAAVLHAGGRFPRGRSAVRRPEPPRHRRRRRRVRQR